MTIKTEFLKFVITSKIAYVLLLSKSGNKYCTLE